MNEVWKGIFEDWIEIYDALDILQNNLIGDKEASELRCKLLVGIIETVRSEVE